MTRVVLRVELDMSASSQDADAILRRAIEGHLNAYPAVRRSLSRYAVVPFDPAAVWAAVEAYAEVAELERGAANPRALMHAKRDRAAKVRALLGLGEDG